MTDYKTIGRHCNEAGNESTKSIYKGDALSQVVTIDCSLCVNSEIPGFINTKVEFYVKYSCTQGFLSSIVTGGFKLWAEALKVYLRTYTRRLFTK